MRRRAPSRYFCLLPLFSCLTFAQESPRSSLIKSVRFFSEPDHTRVVVDLDQAARYRYGRLTAPDRLYLDLAATALDPTVKQQIPVNDPLLKQIRIASNADSSTRVVLDLNSGAHPRVSFVADPPGLAVDLKPEAAAQAVAAVRPPQQAPVAEAAPAETPAPVAPPAPRAPTPEPAPAPAPPVPTREMRLTVGRGELLQFNREVGKMSISEPNIADAVVISPKEIVVNAKGVGNTTLLVWEEGAAPVRYDVTVSLDLAPVEKDLQLAFPAQGIKVTGNQERLVLTGQVKDAAESKRAEALASTRAKEVVNLLTIPPPRKPHQILLQVKFATIDRTALSAVGFNFFSRNDKTLGELSTQQFGNPRFSQLQFQDQNFSNATVNLTDILNIFAFRPDLNLGATIKLLQQRNLLEILAEPNLIVLEGKEASFLAGGEFAFPVVTSTGTGGAVAPVVTVRFREFGVRLNFAPNVTDDGAIQMKVAPEVSALDFANALTIQGFQIPALNTRRAETEVVLNEGESFAIAGLIDNRVVQTLNRVRGLGDLPIIGHLFRSRQTEKTNNELLVVVTPFLVKPLAPGQSPKLPEFPVDPAIAPDKKKPQEQGAAKTPEFIGPRGHQEPKK